MFEDREDAGKQLANALKNYKKNTPLILAIPRGGVEIGYQIAKLLVSEFSIIVTRKLPYPDNPEAGFGAIAEDGSLFLMEEAVQWLDKITINKIIQEQKIEIKRRVKVLRKGKSLPRIFNKTVILVDDGIAMGSTMQAAIMLCRKRKAKHIVIASPVADKKIAKEFELIVDDVVILEKPDMFYAVAQVYRNWHDVSDKEVLQILDTSKNPIKK